MPSDKSMQTEQSKLSRLLQFERAAPAFALERDLGCWTASLTGAVGEGAEMSQTTYMVIEHFRNGNAVPVYKRFRERGRLAPEGLDYIASWVTPDLTRCYQVMSAPDRALLEQWMANWKDLVDFEIYTVITSKEALEQIAPRL